ncbi:P-loop containing nucleoside triphosphate hydrolase protein [Mycena rebaudengoi]|nr:P-loop containing nucleoside triphosphate hydrolase protein [Mycena rebaudengoi]
MFHGRRNILDKLHDYFSQDIGRRHISLLHGLGGAGKTQICLKFLEETDNSRCDLLFTDVFFLDASMIGTIKSGFKNIALTHSVGSEDDDASRWLAASQDEWLLIFDNADDPSINLFNYFPQSSRGNILITSRNPELYVHAPDSHYRISDMEENDAVQLLLASSMQPLNIETEHLAREIVKALYCFPLAVVQAGAYIAKTQKFRNYLALYEQNHAGLLSRLPDQSHDKYAWSVYTTWDISFKCLGELATKFLQICSFLHHERISEDIFSPHFTDMTVEIQGYSLINQDPNTNLFSIHPLVHDWSRKTITDTTSTQQCSAAILAMSTMSNSLDKVFVTSLLPHTNYVLQRDGQLAHKFLYPFLKVFYESGYFERAQELCVDLLENRKHVLGSEHPETLHVMATLSVTYWAMGRLIEAKELKEVVLEKSKEVLGAEHPDTLTAMSNLAATYQSLGKVTDAEELLVVVLEKRKQTLGTEHPDTLRTMSNLAVTYSSLGKLTDAEELKVVVLEKRKQILGTEHPDTLAVMSSLATTYWTLGKFMDAEVLDVAVLENRKKLFGTEHPDTLASMRNLALTYRELGKFTEAEQLLLTVLETRTSILGLEHKETFAAQEKLTELRRHIELYNIKISPDST